MRGIKDSQYLQEVLTTVLAFGNYMNGNTAKMVSGFKLTTLTRLGNTKSSDNKTSLLHYLVQHLEKAKPETRDFLKDLAPTKEAHRIETAFITTEVAALKGIMVQMREAVKGVKAAKEMEGVNDRFVEVMSPVIEAGTVRVNKVEERLKAALHRGEKLAKYFGEGAEMKWEDLFSVFLQFKSQYEAAEADVVRERELEKTRKKNRELQAKLRQGRKGSGASSATATPTG